MRSLLVTLQRVLEVGYQFFWRRELSVGLYVALSAKMAPDNQKYK